MLCFVGPFLLKQTFHVQLICADHCFDFRKNTSKMGFFSFGLCKPVSIGPKNQWLNSRRSQSYLPVSEEPIIKVSIRPPTKNKQKTKNKGLPCSERCIPPGGNKALPHFPKCLLDIPRPLSCRPPLTPAPHCVTLPRSKSHPKEQTVSAWMWKNNKQQVIQVSRTCSDRFTQASRRFFTVFSGPQAESCCTETRF